jgi:hypothetical protein
MLAIIRPGIAERRPFLPALREKAQIFGTMNSCARPLTKYGRFDQIVGPGGKALEQPVGALGLLGGAPDDAAHQKELRIVAAMPFGVDRFQLNILRGSAREHRIRSIS